MNTNPEIEKTRVLLYHKQAISALTQFVLFPDGCVVAPKPLPSLAMPIDEEEQSLDTNKVSQHPATIIQQACGPLGLPIQLLKAQSKFRMQAEVPDGIITIYLARFDTIDPPHDLVDPLGFKLLPLTALRGKSPTEMELLRRAYVYAMES